MTRAISEKNRKIKYGYEFTHCGEMDVLSSLYMCDPCHFMKRDSDIEVVSKRFRPNEVCKMGFAIHGCNVHPPAKGRWDLYYMDPLQESSLCSVGAIMLSREEDIGKLYFREIYDHQDTPEEFSPGDVCVDSGNLVFFTDILSDLEKVDYVDFIKKHSDLLTARKPYCFGYGLVNFGRLGGDGNFDYFLSLNNLGETNGVLVVIDPNCCYPILRSGINIEEGARNVIEAITCGDNIDEEYVLCFVSHGLPVVNMYFCKGYVFEEYFAAGKKIKLEGEGDWDTSMSCQPPSSWETGILVVRLLIDSVENNRIALQFVSGISPRSINKYKGAWLINNMAKISYFAGDSMSKVLGSLDKNNEDLAVSVGSIYSDGPVDNLHTDEACMLREKYRHLYR